MPLDTRPKVFLSFAAEDRPPARDLRDELESRGICTTLHAIPLGDNVIHPELGPSDYQVLLWSANTPSRRWATPSWTSAFALELTRRRAFLFVIRMDESALPPLLVPRNHIDLADAADRLTTIWRADRKSELPVFPQPVPPALSGPTTAISVRSKDIGTTHVVMAPLHVTGSVLHRFVHVALQLPNEQKTHDGTTGLKFKYRLAHQNAPIPDNESTVDARTVDIELHYDQFGAPQQDGVEIDQQRMLLVAAFRHLLP